MEDVLRGWSDRCSHGRLTIERVVSTIYANALEMARDRGLRVVQGCQSVESILQAMDEVEPVLVASGEEHDLHVIFDKEDKTSVKMLRSLLERAPGVGLLIVSKDGVTPWCRRECGETSMLQYFTCKDLLLNPVKHKMVPLHRQLSEAEAEEVMRRYCLLPNQVPLMLPTDRVARWYNFRKGSLVEIVRSGMAQDDTRYYRRVC